MPDQRQAGCAGETTLQTVFIGFKSAFGRADVEVNPIEKAESGKALRRGNFRWRCAYESYSFFQKSRGAVSGRRLFQYIGGFAVAAHGGVNHRKVDRAVWCIGW